MSTQPAARRRYTWQDYRSWPEDERWEIIDGEAFAMSPSPTVRHQSILLELAQQLAPHFRGKPCTLFLAPLDIKFDDENCVEPDLFVVCNPRQIKRTHVEGAPRLVVEIISDSSVMRDRVRKMRLYARFGVKEVWLVTPWPSIVEVFVLSGKTYRLAGAFRKEDACASPTFPDLRLDLARVFDFPPEPGDAVEVVKEPPAAYARK